MSIFQGMKPLQIIQALQDTAERIIKNYQYRRDLTEEEIAEARTNFAQKHLEIAELERQKKEFDEAYKKKMKPLKASAAVELAKVKTRFEFVEGTVYELQNFEGNTIDIYNEDGIVIESRPMRATERQMRIGKTGTHE